MALSKSILDKINQDKEDKKSKKSSSNGNSSYQSSADDQRSETSSAGYSASSDILEKVALDIALKKQGFTHHRETGLLNDSRYEDYYNSISSVNENYINSFISDWNSYANRMKTEYDGMSWESAQKWGLDKSYEDTGKDIMFRAAVIRSYLDSHQDALDWNSYKMLTSQLDDIQKAKGEFDTAFSDAKSFYSQFKTEDEYNQWKQETEEYEALKNFDIQAGEKEITDLEKILEEYRNNIRFATNESEMGRASEIYREYGDERSIKALISEKKQYLNQAKHIQEGITLAGVITNDDFKDKSGYVSTKADGGWKKLTSQFGMGYDDLTYEYINGEESGMRQEIINKAVSYDADTEKFFVYDHMTEDQISTYNYYYAKDGKEAAERYLDSIRETLNYQAATERYDKMEGKTALEMLFGIESGVDQFQSGMKNLFNSEDDYIAQSSTQMLSGMVREDLADNGAKLPDWLGGASIAQVGYDAITTSANMAPSIMTSTVLNIIAPGSGAVVGTAMMGASAAGNAYQEMLNMGYDKSQARAYSTLVGASEAGLQYLLGGISGLGGKLSGNALTKMMKGIDNAFFRTALKLGGNMLSEGIEEGLQEILTPWFQNLIMNTNESVNWSEVAYSTLLGALTAGFMEGTSTISGEVSTYKTGKQLQNADISATRLAEIGKTFSADTVAYQLAGRVNENTGAYTMGRLFNEIGATLSEQNVTEITEALVKEGIPREMAKEKAKTIAKIVDGATLTDGFIEAMDDDKILAKAVKTTIIDPNATWFHRSKGYNEALMALAQDKTSRTNPAKQSQEKAPATGTVDSQNNGAVQSLTEADAVDTSPAKVQTISSINKGQATVKLEDGTEINAKDADLSVDDGVRIETIAQLDGISASDANFVLNTLRTNTNTSAQMDSLGAREVWKYGFYGFSQEHMTTHGVFSNSLTESQRNAIYETARSARQRQVEAKQATVSKKESVGDKKTPTSKVHFEGDRSTLTERQSASLTAMERIADALGVQIYVFESTVNERGKRVGANGWYDPKDSSIHIDLHAGDNGAGTMLFTLAHELTHHIRQWSPAKFKVLADFLMQEYGKKGVNVDALVREQMAKAKRNQRHLTYDEAFEEVVADSMEMMLADGNVMKRLEKLKAQDKDLWHKIKSFIDELAAKIKAVYKGMAPDSVEGRHVAEMGKAVYRLQELFAEGLSDASENYQSSLTPGEESVVVNENGDPVAYSTQDGSVLLSMRTYEEEGRAEFRKYLQKCVSSNKLTETEMQEMMDGIEDIYQTCKEFKDKYAPFSSWSDAAVVRDTYGKPVFSVVTPNGDYKMNLDFSLVCKKRRTLDAVFNEMSRRGIIDDFELGQKSVVKINEIIRRHGLETACALCFVDAKRFRQASMADQFTSLYNELVLSLVPEEQRGSIDHFNFSGYETIKKVEDGIHKWDASKLDFSHLDEVMKNYGKGTVEHKAAKYIKSHAEGRRLLLRGDFMSSQGFDAVKTQNKDILKLYNSKKGTGGPKAAFGDVQYMNEIIKKARTWTPAKAYAVGGVRIQSFSDYVPRMVFDYVQMIYDLAATKLPAHAYTKEALFVKQFGLTGVKINMSLIPAIAEGGIAPGLDADGNYVWAGESFDYETAKEIQNAEGYTENCGTICVGVSDRHIRKLLSDPNIRMVIPYHKSGLNPIVAHMNKIAEFTDYTIEQNTTVKETGAKAEKHFDFNKALHDMGKDADPKAVIQQYFDWCDDNGYEPKFAAFRDHPNYYKLIEDFTLYDKDGKYVPQREVRAVFPNESSAFGSMKKLIESGLKEDAVVEGKRDSRLSSIVDEIQRTLPKTEAEITEEQVSQADRDLEAVDTLRFSHRDTSAVPADISDFVDTSLQNKRSNLQKEIAVASSLDNKAIHRLGAQYNGHYDGALRTVTSNYIRHIIKHHGDPVMEALRGQLHMDADAIKIALSRLQSGQGRVIGKGESIRGNPTIITEIPINGYTLYVEEPVVQLNGMDLEGRTMFMTPTSTKALIPTKSANIPKRRSEGHKVIIDGKKRIVNNFLADANGNTAEVNYIELNGNPYGGRSTNFLYVMSNDADVLAKYTPNGATVSRGNVAISNPYIVTTQNPIFSAEDLEKGLVLDRIGEIKDLGYDAIIMDYTPGDNYMVLAFDKKSVVKFSDRDNAPTFYSHMAKVVDGVKQEKIGAASVVSMLRGKGVKAEEIKWSGIEEWLAGKKSVTKADLQEFIAGSMLQIEEDMLTDKEIPYSQEHLDQIAQYEAERDIIAENLKSEWKRIVGTDIPITYFGAGLESAVVHNLLEANATKKGNTEAGYKYRAARAALQRVIEDGDHYFGFDNARQALREAVRNPKDFMKSYEMTSFEESVFRDFIKAKEAYNKVDGISMEDQKALKAIAESADRFSSRILKVKTEHRTEAAKYLTKYRSYTINGGTNYRELLFRMPGATYSNLSMDTHWERSGVLAHARMQDLNTFLGKMLFIEEIQSDWHNEGHKSGYTSEADLVRISELEDEIAQILTEKDNINQEYDAFLTRYWEEDLSEEEYEQYLSARQNALLDLTYKQRDLEKELYDLSEGNDVPDAPFKDTYHEFVLKRLIRMAAEQDYDSIGWTTADIQSKRWSDEFAEGYRIEYDQDIPKFLNKYGKKWGTRVGKTVLDNGTEVWSMAITDTMKDSVLTEGQPLYSDRDVDSVSNRSLLANAFESVAQNDIERQKIQEYKSKISLINAEERKLQDLNQQIKDLSFAKGPKDTKAIRDLQFLAKQTANRISTYDKQLLTLEASKPLQNVLQREKKMAYQRAEKKGKDALEAYREKTMKTQRELIEKWQDSRKKGIESRQKTAMRHKIKDVVNELNQYLLRGTKDRHVPIELQKAVAEALDAVNTDTVGAEERIAKLQAELLKAKTPEKIQEISRKIDHIREMGDRMNGRLKKLKDAYDQFVNSDDPMIANSHDDVISNKLQSVIESVGDTPLRDMTVTQLEDVYDMYRMVLTTIRNTNKAFKAKKSESISIIANQVMAEVEKVGGKKKQSLAMLNGVKNFGWNNLKPVYAFEHIGSDHFTEVFNNVRAGEDVWALDVTEAREFYLDKSKKHGYDSWDFDKRYKFTSSSGMDFELNLEQIMSLYAYSKREQAADHLKKGGIVFDDSIKVRDEVKIGPFKLEADVAMTDATAYNISDATLAEIISKLTADQKDFVDVMQDYLSTVMGAKGNEVSLEMYGVKLFKEKFYFPLKSAQQFMAKAKEQQKGEVKIKNSGFSKETVQKASNPIVLTPFMNVWADHVNEMSMYHAFVLPMEDFYRVYNYKTPTSDTMATESVEMFIQNAYGKGATKYIDQLLKDLNGGARTDHTTGIINKMMGLFKKVAFFASLSVVIQQPSAIARALALVDTKYFIGPKVDHKRHAALWDEVKQYAPVAVIKEMGYFDTNMGKSTQDFILGKEYSGFSEKMKALFTDSGFRDEALSKAPALADEIAWCGIWEAVKRETKAKYPGLDTKAEPFLKLCGSRFTEVIVKTQVYDSVLSRSGHMRSKDTGMKMATAFMAEPTTSINMIADALLKGKRGNRKYARGAIGAVIASQILNSILVSFVYAGRDDDEDETYAEKYIGTLTGQALDSLNPAGYIPFIKDMISIFKGYDVERSDMAVISDLWKAYENLGKDHISPYRKVEGFAGSIAQIFGLPVKNIMRDARGIYQTIDSFVNGQQTTKTGIGYAVKGAITGKTVSNDQQLYEAILSGDQTQIARVKGRFEDQTSINSAIRKALRANDPRIHEAAVAWNANDLDEYMRIAKQIIGEKYFSQDDVVMAIRAEANALAPDTGTSSSSKAKGLFTAEKFAEAIAQGDQATANAIRLDLIQNAQENGKTAEEAEKSFASTAKGDLKELFLAGTLSESKAIHALTNFCGETQDEAEGIVAEWDFEVEHGFKYDDKKQKFMEGEISANELKDLFITVEGKTEKEANSSIVSYARDAYDDGFFDRSRAASVMVDYGGLTSEEAENKLRYIDVKKQLPDTYVDDAWVEEYYKEVEPSGISIEVFVDYRNQVKEITGEGKKERRMAVINSMPISNAQKDALYYAEGWAASRLYEAPWR